MSTLSLLVRSLLPNFNLQVSDHTSPLFCEVQRHNVLPSITDLHVLSCVLLWMEFKCSSGELEFDYKLHNDTKIRGLFCRESHDCACGSMQWVWSPNWSPDTCTRLWSRSWLRKIGSFIWLQNTFQDEVCNHVNCYYHRNHGCGGKNTPVQCLTKVPSEVRTLTRPFQDF